MSVVPQKPHRLPIVAAAILSAFAAGGIVLLYRHHPAELRLPQCVWYQLTGLYCPGCGSTRALHYLLRGELVLAFRMNALLVLALPVLIWSFLRWLRYTIWGRVPWQVPYAALVTRVVAIAVIAYFILRNVPGLACLAPH